MDPEALIYISNLYGNPKADLYMECQKYLQEENPEIETLSIKTFSMIFEEMKLSLSQKKNI